MFHVLIISLKIILRLVILRWLFMATNQPEEKLEYEDFVGLTVTSLKDFLKLRGLKLFLNHLSTAGFALHYESMFIM